MTQIIEGFSFLHDRGIAHGGYTDPHTGNFGIAVPQLDQLDEETFIDFISNPEVMPVVPRDHRFPMHTIPAYQTPTADVTALLASEKILPTTGEANIKIFDFGRGEKMLLQMQ
ncbi:hypothetical protein TOPH_03894 [Tolypocladium ophioglossoides CBS 100239]|uniref:Protein kinase domain-containing protein n=1 Tax=Tolypocladium ophioglossoides (strain CBS 100239) TaxID=1163406 RepID=A0A0L0NDC9_TOLOC|nr:hypothetical protein TOPH_03894 [Tolypocladium ophioglossoides CBS 100239]